MNIPTYCECQEESGWRPGDSHLCIYPSLASCQATSLGTECSSTLSVLFPKFSFFFLNFSSCRHVGSMTANITAI